MTAAEPDRHTALRRHLIDLTIVGIFVIQNQK